MQTLFDLLLLLLSFIAFWGNLGLGAWLVILGRKRALVVGLVTTWTLASFVLFFLGFAMFGHDPSPPAYVGWLSAAWIAIGLGLFAYLFRQMLPDRRASRSSQQGQ